MIENLKLQLKKLSKNGFFSILLSSVFSKVIAFFSVVVLARILSKENYGIYSYAINAMTMLYLFNDFGASNAALQYLTEAQNDKQRQQIILKFSLKIGLLGSTFSGLLILLSPLFYPYEIVEAKYLTPILFLIPLFSNINAFMSIVLRANFEAKKYAFYELIRTFLNYLFLIVFSLKFGLNGAIISQYFYTIISLFIGLKLTKNLMGKFYKADELKKEEKKNFTKFAITTQISATINNILLNVDIFIIGVVLANSEAVAVYKVASTIPMALSFLPTCIIIYLLPYFVKNNKNFNWIKENYFKLLKVGVLLYGFISVILIIGAKWLIQLLYKEAYYESVLPFQILIIGFFFSATFKIPTNNIMCALRKVKLNLIVDVVSVILNMILNIIFMKLFGIIGPAITTTIINMISSVIFFYYINQIIKINQKEGESYEENSDNHRC